MKNTLSDCYLEYFKQDSNYRFPSRVIVELTNRCNLSCNMCPRRYLDIEEGFLDYGLFKKVIEEISTRPGIGLVPFFRGESLLHPDFIQMMKYAKSKGISPIQLATNAALLDEGMSGAILGLNIDFISFSIDGLTEKIYSNIRRGASLKAVTKNIDVFLAKKKAARLRLPQVQVSMVETSETKDTIEDFVSKWIEKVGRVRIYKEHSSGGFFGSLNNNNTAYPFIGRKPCLKLLTEIAIYWNGDVALCNHDWDRKDSIGNISKSSIEDIWNSRKYRLLRKMHFEDKIDNDVVCAKCDHWMAQYLPNAIIGDLYTKTDNDIFNSDDI